MIPPDRGAWGSFNELRDHNNTIALQVLEKAVRNTEYLEGTDQRKAADFYSLGMDSLAAEVITLLKPVFSPYRRDCQQE